MIPYPRIVAAFLTLGILGCDGASTSPAPSQLHVQATPGNSAPGDSVLVTFTNTGKTELFVQLGCFAVQRRYGTTWLTPETLGGISACNSQLAMIRRLGAAETAERRVRLWTVSSGGLGETGDFRLRYGFRRENDFDVPMQSAYSSTFVVR